MRSLKYYSAIAFLVLVLFTISFSSASLGDIEKSPLKDGKKWAYSISFSNPNEKDSGGIFDTVVSVTLAHVLSPLNLGGLTEFSWVGIFLDLFNFDSTQPYVSEVVDNYSLEKEIAYNSELNKKISLEGIIIRPVEIFGNMSDYNYEFDKASISESPIWIIDYSKGIEENATYPLSSPESFYNHINYLYTNYGAGGTDEVWVATPSKVMDYVKTRENTTPENVTISSGNISFYVNMDNVSSEVENKEITLKISLNDFWKNVSVSGSGLKNYRIDKDTLWINAGEGWIEIINNNPVSDNIKPSLLLYKSEESIPFAWKVNLTWGAYDPNGISIADVYVTNWRNDTVFNSSTESGDSSLSALVLYYAGNYTINLSAMDKAGNTNSVEDYFEIEKWTTRETTPPTINLTLSNDLVRYRDKINVSWQILDNKKVQSVNLSIYNPSYDKIYSSENISGSVVLTGKELYYYGNYTIKIKAVDTSNNANSQTKLFYLQEY